MGLSGSHTRVTGPSSPGGILPAGRNSSVGTKQPPVPAWDELRTNHRSRKLRLDLFPGHARSWPHPLPLSPWLGTLSIKKKRRAAAAPVVA